MLNKQSRSFIFTAGAILTFAGALLELNEMIYGKYIFSAGALLIIITHSLNALDGDPNSRKHRLLRIGFMASLLLALAVYFMFTHSNSWVVAVLIYALITFFLSFRAEV